jgi:uncharacterized protein YjaZ
MVGPWVSEFDESALEQTRSVFRDGLSTSGFGAVQRYIFGDPAAGIPVYAGYTIGYRVVQAFLKRTGKGVVEASFIPAEKIIRESGFFD